MGQGLINPLYRDFLLTIVSAMKNKTTEAPALIGWLGHVQSGVSNVEDDAMQWALTGLRAVTICSVTYKTIKMWIYAQHIFTIAAL